MKSLSEEQRESYGRDGVVFPLRVLEVHEAQQCLAGRAGVGDATECQQRSLVASRAG